MLLLGCFFARAQSEKIVNNFKLSNFTITVTVDSLDDLESTFTVSDFEDILKKVSSDEILSFKLICNDQSKNEHNHISFTVNGNSKKPEEFLESINRIRKSAISYYKNKA